MKGRVDVALGDFKTRGYWIIHPEAKSNPATFTATANGGVAANTLDLYNSATAQRWIFLTADEISSFETGLKEKALSELDEMIANVRKLKLTDHNEDVPGADAALDEQLANIEALAANAVDASEVAVLVDQARTSGLNFLGKVTPTSMMRPFNITFLVKNAAIDDNSGWSTKPTFGNSCCEYFQASFDFNQTITGLPAGIGEPMFGGIESKIAQIVYGIPAVKGIEFGIGFDCACVPGSQSNDDFIIVDGKIMTQTNNSGGILGGISNGMPVIFTTAIKATPSIACKQQSVSLSKMETTPLEVKGRHDPCIVPRAVPVIEAAAAIAIFDLILGNTQAGGVKNGSF